MRSSWLSLWLVASATSIACGAEAQTCAPPPGFSATPQPVIAPVAQLASHTEEITVDRPLAVVAAVNAKTSLKTAIHKAGSLPGVAGEYPLNTIAPGTPGFLHIVCLTDGSTLEEKILVREQTKTSSRFRYVVWRYTSPQARPIEYGVGEFVDTQVDARHTHIVWTYSFKLKENRFPGYLGPLGQFLFHIGFLDRQYAEMMRGTLKAGKVAAESVRNSGPA